jgi:hypothetical protein
MSDLILDPDLAICDPHHHLWDLPETPSGIEKGSPMHVAERHAGDRDVFMLRSQARFRTNARCEGQ